MIVLGFELDANAEFLAFEFHVLTALYPRMHCVTQPVEHFVPTALNLLWAESSDALAEFDLELTEIHCGSVESRREVGSGHVHLFFYGVRKIAEDSTCLSLPLVERQSRRRRDWR